MTIATPMNTMFEQAIQNASTRQLVGKVIQAGGTLLKVTGLPLAIGELCYLSPAGTDRNMEAEVVGITQDYAILNPVGGLQGVTNNTPVYASGRCPDVAVGEQLLGRVVDANGHALDTLHELTNLERVPLYAQPPNPMTRLAIDTVFETGIKAIDSFLTIGEGQRMGIFAAAGAGKSTLMSMLARGSQADINVIALIGERGREVREFVEHNLQHCLSKSIVVVATSDQPALERARAIATATSIAEFFRDQGKRVLLLADSVTRYARALRDVGLAAGEPPTRRGFPPSVFSVLPQMLERVGNNDKGSITAFYTVLMEDEDSADPVAEEVRSILDGHIYLSRKLAAENHYPAIDVLNSVSRVMNQLVDEEHLQLAASSRKLLSKYQDIEVLIQMGEFQFGQDDEADMAKLCHLALQAHLQQQEQQISSYEQALQSLAYSVAKHG